MPTENAKQDSTVDRRSRSRRKSRSRSRKRSYSRKRSSRGHSKVSHHKSYRSRRDRHDNNIQLKVLERLEALEKRFYSESQSRRSLPHESPHRVAVDDKLKPRAAPTVNLSESDSDDSTRDSNKHMSRSTSSDICESVSAGGNRTVDDACGDLIIQAPNEDLLSAVGFPPEAVQQWGMPLNEGLIQRWSTLVENGLSHDARNALMEQYKPPENFLIMQPPKVNPEMDGLLLADGKKKDEVISLFQRQLVCGITAIGNVLSNLVSSTHTSDLMKEACAGLGDSARILLDLNHGMSTRRRTAILPTLNANIRKVAEIGKLDSTLFGDDLAQRVKVAKELEKTTSEMQPKYKSQPKQKRASSGNYNNSASASGKKKFLNFKRLPPKKPPSYHRAGRRQARH